ncbi:hypothetical protein [Tardiphaga sp. 367_B4_N1_1]|uniref:hypothetical protein n=1 Tax=Tardiphaga sp. 367_B4_N1_1 TaxID=3240777 RepID=UPI003F278038
MTISSFYTDGETYDTAVVTSNDRPSSTTPSQAPSSFFTNGGVVGEGTVVNNETGPGPQSNTPSSFFTDGPVVTTGTVESNDSPGNNATSQAPSSFFQDGGLYDYLSQESAILQSLDALAAQVQANAATTQTNTNIATNKAAVATTQANNAATSADHAATSETNAQTSETNSASSAAAAATSEANAHTSETNAAADAATATTQSGIATTQAGISTTKAGQAATSATNAATSETNAAASAAAAAASGAGAVRYDVAQTLNSTQKTQALTNVGAQPAGSYQAALGFTPVNKAGDTVTGNLNIGGMLTVGPSTPNQAGDIGAARTASPTTGVVYLGNSAARYLYYDGSNYNLNGAHLFTAAGRVLGSSTDAGIVSNGRLAYLADFGHGYNTGLQEPYNGGCVTGMSCPAIGGTNVVRYRQMQLMNIVGGWFACNYA